MYDEHSSPLRHKLAAVAFVLVVGQLLLFPTGCSVPSPDETTPPSAAMERELPPLLPSLDPESLKTSCDEVYESESINWALDMSAKSFKAFDGPISVPFGMYERGPVEMDYPEIERVLEYNKKPTRDLTFPPLVLGSPLIQYGNRDKPKTELFYLVRWCERYWSIAYGDPIVATRLNTPPEAP
ncbi:hypothetical protein HN748_00765 [Candidatus Peregrinibacteria bacterium]|jgi:hypothetical protein|nr:hypothetical protein [Candidatus Peregrinibacteria bacterium]MBT7702742.1 hypothetical protein [Candidatus Peregrinibacteria bacterium]